MEMSSTQPVKRLSSSVKSKLRSAIAITTVGQCIEELIFNSVDSEANHIAVRVDLEILRLQVVDDGAGIPESDLTLIGKRYATSKCCSLDDLKSNLTKYGYRGEALASIIEVSRLVQIDTCHKFSVTTYSKLFKNGKEKSIIVSDSCRPSHGTTITIQDFLYNMPVRKKLINQFIDLERIKMLMENIALILPHIEISLRNDRNGINLLKLKKRSSVLDSFLQIFGNHFKKNLVQVNYKFENFDVEGYLSTVPYQNKNLQFLYVNKRLTLHTKLHSLFNYLFSRSSIIKNKNLQENNFNKKSPSSPPKGIKYYGIFIINITCPLIEYDICLEPKKTLIEFRNWEKVLTNFEKMFLKFIDDQNGSINLDDRFKKNAKDYQSIGPEAELQNEIIKASTISINHVKTALHANHISRNRNLNETIKKPEDIIEKGTDLHLKIATTRAEILNNSLHKHSSIIENKNCQDSKILSNKSKISYLIEEKINPKHTNENVVVNGVKLLYDKEESENYASSLNALRGKTTDICVIQNKRLKTEISEMQRLKILSENEELDPEAFVTPICLNSEVPEASPPTTTSKNLFRRIGECNKLKIKKSREGTIRKKNFSISQKIWREYKNEIKKSAILKALKDYKYDIKLNHAKRKSVKVSSTQNLTSDCVFKNRSKQNNEMVDDEKYFSFNPLVNKLNDSVLLNYTTDSYQKKLFDAKVFLQNGSSRLHNQPSFKRHNTSVLNFNQQKFNSQKPLHALDFSQHSFDFTLPEVTNLKHSLNCCDDFLDSKNFVCNKFKHQIKLFDVKNSNNPGIHFKSDQNFFSIYQNHGIGKFDCNFSPPKIKQVNFIAKNKNAASHDENIKLETSVEKLSDFFQLDSEFSDGVQAANCAEKQEDGSPQYGWKPVGYSKMETNLDLKSNFGISRELFSSVEKGKTLPEKDNNLNQTVNDNREKPQISKKENNKNNSPSEHVDISENSDLSQSKKISSKIKNLLSCSQFKFQGKFIKIGGENVINNNEKKISIQISKDRIFQSDKKCAVVHDEGVENREGNKNDERKDVKKQCTQEYSHSSTMLDVNNVAGKRIVAVEQLKNCRMPQTNVDRDSHATKNVRTNGWETITDTDGNKLFLNTRSGNSSYFPPKSDLVSKIKSKRSNIGLPTFKLPVSDEFDYDSKSFMESNFILSHGFKAFLPRRKRNIVDSAASLKVKKVDKLMEEFKTDVKHELKILVDQKISFSEESKNLGSKKFLNSKGFSNFNLENDTLDHILCAMDDPEFERSIKWKNCDEQKIISNVKSDTSNRNCFSNEEKEFPSFVPKNFNLEKVFKRFEVDPKNLAMDAQVLNALNENGEQCSSNIKCCGTIQPYKFDKSMLETSKILGQVDKKFIALTLQFKTEDQLQFKTEDQLQFKAEDQLVLVLVDQHAADERIRLENLIRDSFELRVNAKSGKVTKVLKNSQINPSFGMQFRADQIRIMEQFPDAFNSLGFEFSVNEETVTFHALPKCLVAHEKNEKNTRRCQTASQITKATMVEICDRIIKIGVPVALENDENSRSLTITLNYVLNTIACRSAIKFGDDLTYAECETVIKELSRCKLPFQCAHGRPSLVPIADLNQWKFRGESKRPNLNKLRFATK